jgi:hypothetical protein
MQVFRSEVGGNLFQVFDVFLCGYNLCFYFLQRVFTGLLDVQLSFLGSACAEKVPGVLEGGNFVGADPSEET